MSTRATPFINDFHAEQSREQRLADCAASGSLADLARLLGCESFPSTACLKALRIAAECGQAKCVSLLIPVSGSRSDLSEALIDAARFGHPECVRLLIPVSDPQAKDGKALVLAARFGHAKCVELLVQASDLKIDIYSWALASAAEDGRAECVKLLIPFSDPKADDSYALRWAAYSGHAECVKLLIPVSDPQDEESQALRWASRGGHHECVKLLIPVSDPRADNFASILDAIRGEHHQCVQLLAEAASPPSPKTMLFAFEQGRLPIIETLLGLDLSLIDGIDLPQAQRDASIAGHAALASFISSIIESQDLSQATASPDDALPKAKSSRI